MDMDKIAKALKIVELMDSDAAKTPQSQESVKERPVMVTTEYRGVFFGYLVTAPGEVVTLKRARNCVYWSADLHGFGGLAVSGPSATCKIGPPIQSIELRKVTSISEVSPEAVKAWEAAPWK